MVPARYAYYQLWIWLDYAGEYQGHIGHKIRHIYEHKKENEL